MTSTMFYLLAASFSTALASSLPSTPPIGSSSTSSNITCLPAPPSKYLSHTTVSDPRACLATCGAYEEDHHERISAVLSAAASSADGIWECYCVAAVEIPEMSMTGKGCPGGWYVYTSASDDLEGSLNQEEKEGEEVEEGTEALSTQTPAPLVLQNKRDRKRSIGLCADDKRPCKVRGEDSSYQCIDVQSSLHSCGACVAGEYVIGGINATVLGHDCTALPGVSSSDVQCKAGVCIVGSCVDGFRLADGRCVRV